MLRTLGAATLILAAATAAPRAEVGDIAAIDKDRRTAARAYPALAKDTKNSIDDIVAIVSDKDYAYKLSPEQVFKTATFMARLGSVKNKPESWKDLFFPEIHALPGD